MGFRGSGFTGFRGLGVQGFGVLGFWPRLGLQEEQFTCLSIPGVVPNPKP